MMKKFLMIFNIILILLAFVFAEEESRYSSPSFYTEPFSEPFRVKINNGELVILFIKNNDSAIEQAGAPYLEIYNLFLSKDTTNFSFVNSIYMPEEIVDVFMYDSLVQDKPDQKSIFLITKYYDDSRNIEVYSLMELDILIEYNIAKVSFFESNDPGGFWQNCNDNSFDPNREEDINCQYKTRESIINYIKMAKKQILSH